MCVCFKFTKFIPKSNIPWNIKMGILFQSIWEKYVWLTL